MNRYEEKLEARRERLLARAAKHRAISEASFKRVERITSVIPLGQPILVGHHSERHARKDQERIHNGMRKGIDEGKYADELEARAEAVGSAGIATEDPDAVDKLAEKVAQAERKQEKMKAANKIIRKMKDNPAACILTLQAEGFTESQAAQLLKPDFCGRIGFPDYALTNNGANIRRMKARMEQIGKLQATPATTIESETGITFEDATDENRVRLYFPGKPAEDIRRRLKQAGFRWAPSLGCWQAFRNWGTIQTAQNFVKTAGATATADGPMIEATQGRTIWNSDGTDGPVLITTPPKSDSDQ